MYLRISLRLRNVTTVWKDGRRETLHSVTDEEKARVTSILACQCVAALKVRFPSVNWEAYPDDDDAGDMIVQASKDIDASTIVSVVQGVVRRGDFTDLSSYKPWEDN